MFTETPLMSPVRNPVRIHHLVQDIAQAIAGATLGEVFATVNRLVAEALGARHTCIHLLDPTGISEDTLARTVGTCPSLEARPEDMRTFMIAERDWNQHAAQATDHVAQWSNWRALIEGSKQFRQGFAFNEGIAVPLCYGDEAYGVFNIYLTGTVPIGHEELDSLLLLGPLLYGAIRRELHILEIESLSQQLAEASRHKSEFLAGMSHELRTPLNAILGFSELLLDGHSGPLTEKQQRQLTHIQTSGRHLLQLINGVLDFSKVEAGKLDIEPRPVNLSNLISDVLAVTEPIAQKKGVSLHLQGESSVPPISADPLRIQQVLLNLVSNAIKFTPQGGRILIRLWQEGDTLAVSVTDTGVGISPQDAGKLFREFTQLSRRNNQPREGTGLGLALAKRLVELHGGQIWAESEGEGHGSTFHIRLPVQSTSLSVA
ncbi:MAG: hypothetical protein HYT85_06575 [candidate division NC10 bacterium]|nr:hypothetical protein [candidate division NC10 bacterium]MBI2114732.1 hypothetical protein [candidate division NC10 bacterium]MBI2456114.1 hypothetical protein [candidate division NC10 bacterium]MBI3084206.1 hypothetical protein [candidate division NC10 bacterium]